MGPPHHWDPPTDSFMGPHGDPHHLYPLLKTPIRTLLLGTPPIPPHSIETLLPPLWDPPPFWPPPLIRPYLNEELPNMAVQPKTKPPP